MGRMSPRFRNQLTDIDTVQQSNNLNHAKKHTRPRNREEWNAVFTGGNNCKRWCDEDDQQEDCRTCMSYRRISPAFRNMHSDERTFRVGQKREGPEGRAQ